MANANVFINKENLDHISLVNGSSAMALYDFTVIAPYVCIADEVIAATTAGMFNVTEGLEVASANLHATENTFATLNQIVYFDPAGTFSDTSGATYFPVGYITKVKDSEGVIKFNKLKYTEVVGGE